MGIRDIQRSVKLTGISPAAFHRPGRGILKFFHSKPQMSAGHGFEVPISLTTTIYFRSGLCVKDGDLASGLYRG